MAITNVPNEGEFSRDRRANGYLPLAGAASPVNPPNNGGMLRDGDPGGSASMAKMPSPINPPNNNQFRSGDKGTSGPASANPSAEMPGRGAVPVNPYLVSGGIRPAMAEADEATKRFVRR